MHLFVAASAVATFVVAQDLPVVASHLVTGANSQIELTNTGEQPVTAWSLAVVTPAEGRGTHRIIETVDAYLSEVTRGLPGSSEKTDRLLPGQSRRISLDPLPADATAQLIAVVMEDKTAFGDADTITSIFARRAAERDELHRVNDIFADVLGTRRGIAALEELQGRLSLQAVQGTSAPHPQESTPHRAAREAVDVYLRAAKAGDVDGSDRAIREYAAVVARQYELAVRHSRG